MSQEQVQVRGRRTAKETGTEKAVKLKELDEIKQ